MAQRASRPDKVLVKAYALKPRLDSTKTTQADDVRLTIRGNARLVADFDIYRSGVAQTKPNAIKSPSTPTNTNLTLESLCTKWWAPP